MKNPSELLYSAAEIINERATTYGNFEQNLQLTADIASLRLGRDIHPYEVCVVLTSLKNARSFSDPQNVDSHIDGVNYELFATAFANDYVNSKAGGNADISFKKKSELTVAKMEPLQATQPSRQRQPLAVQDAIQNALGKLDADAE
jgi:hypothetical protein